MSENVIHLYPSNFALFNWLISMDEIKDSQNIERIPSETEDDYSDDDLYNINAWGADLSFRELITMWEEEELTKPEIQRNYVWDKTEASRFIESLLMGLPVPSIFLAQKGTKKLIIDGYQRVMTVRDYVKGIFTKDNSVFKLSNSRKINVRWRGMTFEQLSEDDKRRIKSTTIHAIIFEQKEPKDSDTSLYQIFERINTGGRTLNSQEIRNCVSQGKLNRLLIKLNQLPDWRVTYGQSKPEQRMEDIELILRFLTLNPEHKFKSSAQQISLKRELDLFINDKNNNSEENLKKFEKDFSDTVTFIRTRIGEDAFKNIQVEGDEVKVLNKFHPTIFDSIAIATLVAIKSSNNIPDDLRVRRVALLKDQEYIKAITERTTNIENINKRISLASRYLYDISKPDA